MIVFMWTPQPQLHQKFRHQSDRVFQVFPRTMPSQREVTNALKATAQSVVESLKFLLVILMSQLEVVDPERTVPDDQAQAIQRLNNEVMSQRNRIEEIARLLRQPGSPSQSEFNLSPTLISDDEFEHVDLASLPMAETSPPRRTPARVTPPRATSARAMVSSVPAMPMPTTTPTVVATAGDPIGSHSPSPGIMGQQAHFLGKETRFEEIPRSLRERPWLHRVDSSKGKFSHTSHVRLSDILSSPRRHGTKRPPVRAQDRLIEHLLLVESEEEMKWLMACRTDVETTPSQLDLLEVYAQTDSRLSSEVSRLGGRSKRFTRQDGDLSQFSGQVQLLKTIFRHQPKHVWLAPECAPWCSWNRFNMNRSRSSYDHVIKSQEESRTHLRLCALIAKIQLDSHRHIHVENPGTSSMWKQPEMEPVLLRTLPTFLDQCRFGLKHPETELPLQKRTRVQTSYRSLHRALDGRICQGNHQHAAIEGSCRVDNHRMAVSRFAAWYPRHFARTIAKALMSTESTEDCYPIVPLVPVVDDHPRPEETETRQTKRAKRDEIESKEHREIHYESEESVAKRAKQEESLDKSKERILEDQPWKELFQELQKVLPKSGVTVWNDQRLPLIQQVQQLVPDYEIQSLMAGKGREKFMVHPEGLVNRHTFVQKRLSHQIVDLGFEDLTGTSKRHQGRKTVSSHIMMCVFGRPKTDDRPLEPQDHPSTVPVKGSESIDGPVSLEAIPLSSWTATAVSQSGPKFQGLNSEQQSMIRKLHNNLGHPTSERLAKHLKDKGSPDEVVEGAKDFLCSSCVERRPPGLHNPGQLREAQDFNYRVLIDGFEWKSNRGKYKAYVLHAYHWWSYPFSSRSTDTTGWSTCSTDLWRLLVIVGWNPSSGSCRLRRWVCVRNLETVST